MRKHFSTGSFIVGIILGVLLMSIQFYRGFTAGSQPPASLFVATSTTPTVKEGGSISIDGQAAGNMVSVESVTVPAPGVWVAVREVIDNDLGNVLGAVRISGPRSHIAIPLLRATEPGRTYAIQLYRDDAGGTFDATVNSTYVDFDTGARAVAYFTTAD